ncbi:hypothetical protein [Phenylobacterium sp.]|uniref:8-oxoguanine DNA glycosylase OGG fold protein n=1 Tax=Phenylobacterium sp. TaxID=1871053 RepID=UPI0035B095D5
MTAAEPSFTLCPSLVATLAACPIEPQGVIGRAPRAWANHVEAGLGDRLALDETRIDRARLFGLAREGQPEKFFLSVMAWGGMKVGHGISAWAERAHWSPALDAALAGGLPRAELYRRFAAVPTTGMRAAYFTKLIHFASALNEAPVGYIMDQWTAKSVNMICRSQVVTLDAAGYVLPINDHQVYEAFCKAVDALGEALQISGAQAEERIYSRGGRKPAAWRRHVKTHWRPAVRPKKEEN